MRTVRRATNDFNPKTSPLTPIQSNRARARERTHEATRGAPDVNEAHPLARRARLSERARARFEFGCAAKDRARMETKTWRRGHRRANFVARSRLQLARRDSRRTGRRAGTGSAAEETSCARRWPTSGSYLALRDQHGQISFIVPATSRASGRPAKAPAGRSSSASAAIAGWFPTWTRAASLGGRRLTSTTDRGHPVGHRDRPEAGAPVEGPLPAASRGPGAARRHPRDDRASASRRLDPRSPGPSILPIGTAVWLQRDHSYRESV
jgi:hypothetical protein